MRIYTNSPPVGNRPASQRHMGQVFKAWQRRLRRLAALKVVRREMVANPDMEMLARFHREAVAVAQLDHPNIVRVYDPARSRSRRPLAATRS